MRQDERSIERVREGEHAEELFRLISESTCEGDEGISAVLACVALTHARTKHQVTIGIDVILRADTSEQTSEHEQQSRRHDLQSESNHHPVRSPSFRV